MKWLNSIVLFFILACALNAEIFHLTPEDSIDDLTEYFSPGDTVLLAPGIYDRASFNIEVPLTFAGWFLITGNHEHIGATILDNGRVGDYLFQATLSRFEDWDYPVNLKGLTLNGCDNAVIYVSGVDCIISHCKILDNLGYNRFRIMENLTIESSIFSGTRLNNRSVLRTDEVDNISISNSIFATNRATRSLHLDDLESLIVDRSTFYDNNLSGNSGIYIDDFDDDSWYIVSNSILYNDIDLEMNFSAMCEGTLYVDYSNIDDGDDALRMGSAGLYYGETNINEDPLIEVTEDFDYAYDEDSPCLDAGDPNSPDDPDGSRADMGASFLFDSRRLSFSISDSITSEPVQDVYIFIEPIPVPLDTTDDNGCAELLVGAEINLTLRLSKAGFAETILRDVNLDNRDSLHLSVTMLRPTFALSCSSIYVNPDHDDSLTETFTIINDGVSDLSWQIEKRLREEHDVDNFQLISSLDLSSITDDERLKGIIFTGELYCVSGANYVAGDDGDNIIYLIDRSGEWVDNFTQPDPENRIGMADLAWDADEQLIWGGVDSMVYALNLEGDIVESWSSGFSRGSVHAITYSPESDLLYLASISSDIYSFTRDGQVQDTIQRGEFRNYGFAWWHDDPHGFPLYVLSRQGNESLKLLKIDPASDSVMVVEDFNPSPTISAGGISITDYIDRYGISLLHLADTDTGDYRLRWQLHKNVDWFSLDTLSGVLAPNSEQDVSVTFTAADVILDIYEGRLRILHNALGDEFYMPITMDVFLNSQSGFILHPSSFSLTVFPNPFNSSTRLTYTVPQPGLVTLKLFDLKGRELMYHTHEVSATSRHFWTIDGSELPAGMYIARLATENAVRAAKIICLK